MANATADTTKQCSPFQPIASLTHDEQIITAVLARNPKTVELTADAEGNIYVDKDLHPDIYDWAVND